MTADREARDGNERDLPEIARLLQQHGITVAASSLEERVASDGSGIVVTDGACASWIVDGGAVHLYDIVAGAVTIAPLLEQIDALARARFAAVLSATLYADDPVVAVLRSHGFDIDWDEPDVREGRPARLVGLVREVA